ncbi:MAG: hypothetical protein Q9166_005723 [cf. Caloplaca sp. 2 TL-2023]
MGYKRDQNYHAETFRPPSIEDHAGPELPPPYTEESQSVPRAPTLPPRQSPITPPVAGGKPKLLLLYVHGFTGNESSFQIFPTDVHNRISQRLKDVCEVQSMIYPKYKSRKKIEFARDELSSWQAAYIRSDFQMLILEHESKNTNIVLLGHSMGGLLAAEVALLPAEHGFGSRLKHHILGTVNLDVPFLGIHPGIVASGISSLFRKAPEESKESKASDQKQLMDPSISVDMPYSCPSPSATEEPPASSTLAASSNFLPTLSSLSLDSHGISPGLPQTTGPKRSRLSSALYFINKHSDGLTRATKSYLTSHIEFGGCLVDYKGLISRYSRIRALEDDQRSRVRFVNYYTASIGRPKKQKPPPSPNSKHKNDSRNQGNEDGHPSALKTNLQYLSPRVSTEAEDDESPVLREASSQIVSGEESSDSTCGNAIDSSKASPLKSTSPPIRDPPSIPSSATAITTSPDGLNASALSSTDVLPPLPGLPSKPLPLIRSLYTDKDALKIAIRDHGRATKAFNRLLKDRDNAIKDRRKLLAKRAKATAREQQKAAKGKGKPNEKLDTSVTIDSGSEHVEVDDATTQVSQSTSPVPSLSVPTQSTPSEAKASKVHATPPKQHKPPKYRPFCLLPHQPDQTWIRITMRDVDEIDAHCGLFAQDGEHYEGFVQDLVERLDDWYAIAR